ILFTGYRQPIELRDIQKRREEMPKAYAAVLQVVLKVTITEVLENGFEKSRPEVMVGFRPRSRVEYPTHNGSITLHMPPTEMYPVDTPWKLFICRINMRCRCWND